MSGDQTKTQWLAGVAAPARRALAAAGFTCLEQLAGVSETGLLALHGMGPKAVQALKAGLAAQGKTFTE